MTGWAQPMTDAPPETLSVAIIVASDFPDIQVIDDVIGAGIARNPDTVFVVREKDKLATEAFKRIGWEYVSAGLNPYYKFPWHNQDGEPTEADRRSEVRESELCQFCNRVIVFKTPKSGTLDFFLDERWASKVRVIERGAAPAKKQRKGRKVE